MKGKFLQFISLYFLIFIAFFPVRIVFFELQENLTTLIFGDISRYFAKLFNARSLFVDFSSDSFSMLFLMITLGIIALIISLFIKDGKQLIRIGQKICVYYIAIILLKYGADKLFKGQFYLPEPNILFTKFGNLDQDILFWSLMGTSRSYSRILGSIEIGLAILLFFKKTRFLGLILAFFTFINILIINFSFDISVKLFSITLFLMSVFALKDYWKPLYLIFIEKKSIPFQISELNVPEKIKSFVFPLKILMIGFVFLQVFLPYITSKSYNDDISKRPFLHGAYEVLQDQNNDKKDLKYLFFHRDQYLIFMNEKDEMQDFLYEIDTVNKRITNGNHQQKPFSFNYTYMQKDSILYLKSDEEILKLKEINWRKMPALKSKFHWIVD